MSEQIVLSIDPGPVNSAAVWLIGERIQHFGIYDNTQMLKHLEYVNHLAIEMIASYGMPVGKDVFETCVWIGRFIERCPAAYTYVYRKDVKLNLCGNPRAKDANVRQALIDRCGEIGTKKKPGPLYGISKDLWSALAIGLTWQDTHSASVFAESET